HLAGPGDRDRLWDEDAALQPDLIVDHRLHDRRVHHVHRGAAGLRLHGHPGLGGLDAYRAAGARVPPVSRVRGVSRARRVLSVVRLLAADRARHAGYGRRLSHPGWRQDALASLATRRIADRLSGIESK